MMLWLGIVGSGLVLFSIAAYMKITQVATNAAVKGASVEQYQKVLTFYFIVVIVFGFISYLIRPSTLHSRSTKR